MTRPFSLVACAVAFGVSLIPALSAQEIAREVPPGREIRDTKLLTLGKTDRWDLEVAAGEVVWCKVDSQGFDPVLQLVDESGDLLAENDGRGTKSEIWHRFKSAGKIAFRVRGFEGAGGGQYGFWLERYRTQELGFGKKAAHEFGRERWWHIAVELEEGAILVPTVTGAGRLTAVFDSSRNQLKATLGGYRAQVSGLHFLRVEGRQRHRCHCRLALARQRDLGEPGQIVDTIEGRGLDIWRVKLQAHQPYEFRRSMFDSILQVDLRERTPRRGRAFVWTGEVQHAGNQRSWLMPRRDAVVELLFRNPAERPARYRAGLVVTGRRLKSAVDRDDSISFCGGQVYRLKTQPGELIRLQAQSDAFAGKIEVWDREGNVLHQNEGRSLTNPNPLVTFPVTLPGDHWLLVTCPGGRGRGTFTVRMDSLPIAQLEVGGTKKFEFQKKGTSYAHLELTRGQEIWLSVRSAALDSAVTVLAPDGKPIGTFERGGVDKDVLTAIRARQEGRHTLQIHGRGAGVCEVRIVRP